MAAYGTLVSLSHLLHQILHPPPLFHNIIVIHKQQVEFLQGKIEILIDFLETYPSRRSEEIADLEARIRDVAFEAEDIVESNVVDQIHASDLYRGVSSPILSSVTNIITSCWLFLNEKGTVPLCEGIEWVLEKFLSIEKELLAMRLVQGVGDVQFKKLAATRSPLVPGAGGKITMVGFDHHLIQIMSQLATDESSLQIIPIVGMGGIGKTTLATAVYNDPFIVEHFHVHAWVTVSQEYNVQELLLGLLYGSGSHKAGSDNGELGLNLHKKLFGRKYLIVMDDMWDIQSWDEVKRFLPDNENGSRVLVTSRLSNLAADLGSCLPYKMDFLDEGRSWDLFRTTIFGEEDCPVKLEDAGKYIVKRCSGLPLALVLISGLLAKSERTKEHWEFFAGDMTSAMNSGNMDQVMKILSLSYTHLPVYLKPCFLYLAMFPENLEIRVSMLVRLWVDEGLIKPSQHKCLEEIATEYWEDLVSRNLILAGQRGSKGNVKYCKLHDLVRDFCNTQAEKEKFVYKAKLVDSPGISPIMNKTARRLSVSTTGKIKRGKAVDAMGSAELNRSLLSRHNELIFDVATMKNFSLLKVVHGGDYNFSELRNLTNLRHVYSHSAPSFLSMALCWNLQTLLLPRGGISDQPTEIWVMPQLRHLKMYSFKLPDPPYDDDQDMIVLRNLQTIKVVENFKCSKDVLKRIPNLKTLGAAYSYEASDAKEQAWRFCLHNLAHFEKLESLVLFGGDKLWLTITFPISLKKLKFYGCGIHWGDLSIVGSLPNLEVLKIDCGSINHEWNPIEGQFCRLKFLFIRNCYLHIWGAENYHFPCLEHLVLKIVPLEMIPMSFSEILTLQQIDLEEVNDSMRTSARDISNEREQLGYEPLRLRLR